MRDLAIGRRDLPDALCSDRAVVGASSPAGTPSLCAAAGTSTWRAAAPACAHLVEAVAGRGRAAGPLQAEHLADRAQRAAHGFGDNACHRRKRTGRPLPASPNCSRPRTPGPCSTLTLSSVDVEFFRHQGGERRRDALPHLGARRDHGDRVVRSDLDEGIERRLALGELAFERVRIGLAVVLIADGDAAGDRGGADQECAAGDLVRGWPWSDSPPSSSAAPS